MGEHGFEKEFVDEICKVWELNDSVIYLPLKLEQTSGLVATIPEGYDRHGLLHVKIVYSTRDNDALVYHEGAHVYLFHLGYPPAQMRRIDFINEYYACKLELQKRFDDDARRLDELIGDLGTKRIELEVLLGPVGQAIATKLREYWGRSPQATLLFSDRPMTAWSARPTPPNYLEKQCHLPRMKKARSGSSLENHSRGSIQENKFSSLKNLSIPESQSDSALGKHDKKL